LTIVVVSNELSTDKWLSGLRLHQLDLPRELEEKQPFRRVTELYLNETLLRPEQVNDSSMVQNNSVAKISIPRSEFYSTPSFQIYSDSPY
jgi:hypothetical protein